MLVAFATTPPYAQQHHHSLTQPLQTGQPQRATRTPGNSSVGQSPPVLKKEQPQHISSTLSGLQEYQQPTFRTSAMGTQQLHPRELPAPPLTPLSPSRESPQAPSAMISNGKQSQIPTLTRTMSLPKPSPLDQPSGSTYSYKRSGSSTNSGKHNFQSPRRSIFGTACKQQPTAPHSFPPQHRVHETGEDGSHSTASSQSTEAAVNSSSSDSNLLARLRIQQLVRPPVDAKYLQDKPHFVEMNSSSMDNLNQLNQQQQQQSAAAAANDDIGSSSAEQHLGLPELPTPLRRFYVEPSDSDPAFFTGSPSHMTKPLGGVYPLMSHAPAPILRDSSYQSLHGGGEASTTHHTSSSSSSSLSASSPSKNPHPASLLATAASSSFNLTETLRQKPKRIVSIAPVPSTNGISPVTRIHTRTGSTGSSSTSSVGNRPSGRHPRGRVQFDPRVTVTEYQDSCPRFWFNELELERFKCETMNVVRKYLLQNPELISLYNQPQFDPITSTYRRKALFSIPVLSHLYDKTASTNVAQQQEKKQTQSLVRAMNSQVKFIVIAVRNRLVQDLLSRSMQSLFPHATVQTVSTGEEAFELYCQGRVSTGSPKKQPPQPVDIIIAEGRLNMQRGVGSTETSGNSTNHPQGQSQHHHHHRTMDERDLEQVQQFNEQQGDVNARSELPKRNSLSDLTLETDTKTEEGTVCSANKSGAKKKTFLSGADLFQRISALEEIGAPASPSTKRPPSKAVLMIGLSTTTTRPPQEPASPSVNSQNDTNQEQPPKLSEGQAMKDKGASLVWGLPPPPMDDRRRYEIVSTLLQKRATQAAQHHYQQCRSESM